MISKSDIETTDTENMLSETRGCNIVLIQYFGTINVAFYRVMSYYWV